MTLTVGSLFSGIGGLDLGLERAGHKVIWQSEIDPYACKVLERHWPETPNIGDITSVDWTQVERPDILCGGYPCQPFSVAGRRQGSDDPRHLWPAMRDAVRILRPRYVIGENVRGHLSLGFYEVLQDLSSLGYDAEWDIVPASAVGAPHQRERLFWVAHNANSYRSGNELRGEPEVVVRPENVPSIHREERWGTTISLVEDAAQWGPYTSQIREWAGVVGRPAPALLRTESGKDVPSPLFTEWVMGFPCGWTQGEGRLPHRLLGNAVVPQVAELIGRLIP